MAAFNGSTDALLGDAFFGEFTNGGDFLVGGLPEAVWPLSDGETGVSSGPAASPTSLPPSHQPTPPSSPLTDADLLALFPDLADFYRDCTAAARGEDVSGPGRLYSSLPASTPTFPGPAVAPGALCGPWESPETLSWEGVSGPGRLYPSPSPPTFPGPAFPPGANDYGENPQHFWPAASSSAAAFPLEAPVPLNPFAASWPLAPSHAGEGPSGGLPVWLDRPASTPAFPSAAATAIGGPPRRASAPDCLAAFAPAWGEPVDPAFAFGFGGAPTHPTTADVWTAGLGLDFAPASGMAFGGAPHTTTTTDVWSAGPGLGFAPAPAITSGGAPPASTNEDWTALLGAPPAPFPTTSAPPCTTRPPVRPAATSGPPAPAPAPTILLPSTTTTLLRTANAAARRKRPPPPTRTDGPPPAKKKRGPGRRAKYADVTGFLVATVADAGALGHAEGPTTMVEAPRSGRWRVNGERVEKGGKRKRGGGRKE